ncbi:MAG TPA: hypothetical protein VJ745_06210 [Gaiellaceae bacterium]|nr:hypothetical protein [Gaiellaceae bacterium]
MKVAHTSLRLRIVPGARRSGIVGRHGDGKVVSYEGMTSEAADGKLAAAAEQDR